MGTKGEMGVKSDTQDFGVFVEGEGKVVECDRWDYVGLMEIRSKKGYGGF